MRFVKNFTPPDFQNQAQNLTPVISLNFNSYSDKNTKMSVFGEIYTTGKKFTLPSAVTALTNITSIRLYAVIVAIVDENILRGRRANFQWDGCSHDILFGTKFR